MSLRNNRWICTGAKYVPGYTPANSNTLGLVMSTQVKIVERKSLLIISSVLSERRHRVSLQNSSLKTHKPCPFSNHLKINTFYT